MISRVAYLSMHTSPLLQPGVGTAGGMNVYVDELARAMAGRGVEVDVFTRTDQPGLPPVVEVVPGYRVHHIDAGPAVGISVERLPRYVAAFAAGVERVLEQLPPVDVIHSHYWLSGWAGVLIKRRFGMPLANSFHTLGRVKNLTKRRDEAPESLLRIAAEAEVIGASDCVVAATPAEADELLNHYGADPTALCVSPPGLNHDVFFPGSGRHVRDRLDIGDAPLVAFVGRVQPLKGVDVALGAFDLVARQLPDATLLVVGGPSGPDGEAEMAALRVRADAGAGRVVFTDPLPHRTLAEVYRAANVLHVPSRSESFGLVAVEAQACGTPVVASRVGGLIYSVDDGVSGVLVDGWDSADHAAALMSILSDDERAAMLSKQAVDWAGNFSWDNTVDRFLQLYAGVAPRRV